MLKKVLITGGAGFIGSHIIDKLLESGYKIVIIDNLSTGSLDNIQKNNNIIFYKSDIYNDDIEYIFKKEQPDFCIHLAAQTSVANSENDPIFDAQINIISSINVLKLCEKYKIKKFITASSAAVYGIPNKLPLDENSKTHPISFYGLSKLSMEEYVKLFNVPYIIFRFSNVFGPRQASSKESGVIAIFHDAMQNNKPINIYGDGEQIRDFVFVKDIAQIVVTAIETDISNEIFNFSSNTGITINKLFNLMKNIYNYNLSASYFPPREGDIKNSILSNEKALQTFPNVKNTNLFDGLQELKNYKITCSIN